MATSDPARVYSGCDAERLTDRREYGVPRTSNRASANVAAGQKNVDGALHDSEHPRRHTSQVGRGADGFAQGITSHFLRFNRRRRAELNSAILPADEWRGDCEEPSRPDESEI